MAGWVGLLCCADVTAAPLIDPNYLSTERDLVVAEEAIRVTRDIVAQKAFSKYNPVERRPGPELNSREQIRAGAAGKQPN